MTKSVQEYLDEVDYQKIEQYSPSEFAIGFVSFIKLIHGSDGIENETPIIHYKMLDSLVLGHRQIATMIFRGAGKSTLMAQYLFFYLAVFRELGDMKDLNYAVYVSDSIDNGVKVTRRGMQKMWENSEFLQNYLPQSKITDIRWEFINKEGKSFVISAYGAKSGVRGTRENNKRPQIAVLDDMVADDDAKSPTVLESIKATVYEAVMQALHPKQQKVIWLGTPFNANDPLYEAIQSGAWYSNVYPVCEKFPCKRSEFKGAWEDRFSYDYIKSKYDTAVAVGRVDGFYRELMLSIMSDDDRLITDNDIQWFNLTDLLKNKSNFNFYITTDFATSEKDSADYSFISVWAVNHKGYYFWIDGVCERQTMDKNIDDLFRLVSTYNPISVGVEVSGQQAGFIAWIKREMLSRNIWFSLASNSKEGIEGLKPNKNKLERFNVVVPDFKLKRFYFPMELKHTPALKELLTELRQASVGGFKSKHDDGLDTISMLGMMPIWLPSSETNFKQRKSMLWDIDNEIDETSTLTSYLV